MEAEERVSSRVHLVAQGTERERARPVEPHRWLGINRNAMDFLLSVSAPSRQPRKHEAGQHETRMSVVSFVTRRAKSSYTGFMARPFSFVDRI